MIINVLHIHENLDVKGGSEVYLHRLCKESEQYGIISHLVAIRKIGLSYLFEILNGKKFQNLDIHQICRLVTIYIAESAVEIINIHGISDPDLTKFLLDMSIPVVKTLHEPRLFCPGSQKFWRNSERICTKPFSLRCLWYAYKEGCCNRNPQRLYESMRNVYFELNQAVRNYRSLIVMSNYMKRELMNIGISDRKIVINPYFTPAVDMSIRDQSRRDVINILFVGRLLPSKGAHIMLEAVLPMLDRYHNLCLNIVGKGYQERSLREVVKDSSQKNVNFLGWLDSDEIKQLMLSSDILIFPSIYPEAFGIVGIEAMACGLPAIAFDVGGISDWLSDGYTGFLLDRVDASLLREKITFLIENTQILNTFRVNCQEQAKQYLAHKHISHLKDIYLEALQDSRNDD